MIKTYICGDCEYIFDEDDLKKWEQPHGEIIIGCPKCGGNPVETFKCDCCDEWISGEYIKIENGDRFCEKCISYGNIIND